MGESHIIHSQRGRASPPIRLLLRPLNGPSSSDSGQVRASEPKGISPLNTLCRDDNAGNISQSGARWARTSPSEGASGWSAPSHLRRAVHDRRTTLRAIVATVARRRRKPVFPAHACGDADEGLDLNRIKARRHDPRGSAPCSSTLVHIPVSCACFNSVRRFPAVPSSIGSFCCFGDQNPLIRQVEPD